ncbi:MAG: TolC family protein [Chitinophagaceae bacterium]|nr:TolC family protein [Chitinophagaceae bacterium]MCW5905128.1 TolC family protein [Chitinophagaceae bacterium]
MISNAIFAQKKITLEEAEALFLKNNLSLIAENFNISAADALILQAKIWENPIFSAEINAINPEQRKVFDIGANGDKAFAIEQLIYMGGKKKKEIELAKTNKEIATLMLADLLRNLKYQLRTCYFSMYYDEQNANSLAKQFTNLDTLIASYNTQTQKGNIALKELVRLQTLYLNFKNEYAQLLSTVQDEKSILNTLLSSTEEYSIAPTKEELAAYTNTVPVKPAYLVSLAMSNRPDIKLAEKQIQASKQNLLYQKALAVPDITLGANYEQLGGAFKNQVNLTLSVPLKLHNVNKGNIKLAETKIEQSEIQKKQIDIQVANEISNAYNKYKISLENYSHLNNYMQKNFDEVAEGMFKNFQRRNITILEFTDFMESYINTIGQINDIKKNLAQTCEQLHFVTNTQIF